MLKEKLEILLITYNRAAYLDSTLRQFSESPFRDCRFTILDNCSEDETPAICEKYRSLLTGLTVIRHPKNIGANGNQLRSLEISKADYTWLICDDDVYDFSSVSDLVNVMEEGSSDLIVVGTWDDLNIEQGVFTTTQALLLEQKRYFSIALFGPSVIYRTELLDSRRIRDGYLSTANLYNTFPFYYEMLKRNSTVYVASNQVVRSGGNDAHGFTYFDLALAQLDMLSLIDEKNYRYRTVEELVFAKGAFSIAGYIILAKALYGMPLIFYRIQAAKKITAAAFSLSFTQKMKYFFGLLFLLMPRFACKFIRNRYIRSIQGSCLSKEDEDKLIVEQNKRASTL